MPSYLNTFRNALITLIGTSWPEVIDNGIYRTRDLARLDFDQKAGADALPLCVLDLDATPAQDYGLVTRTDRIMARVYYVTDDSTAADGLITKLETLRTALWPANGGTNPLSSGQVVEYPQITDSADLPVNRYFLSRGFHYYTGAVFAQCIAGEDGRA